MKKGREQIEPNKGNRPYPRRSASGQFTEQDEVGRSLSQDRRKAAKTTVKKGQGDRGDRKR